MPLSRVVKLIRLLSADGECYRNKSLRTARHLDAIDGVLGLYGERYIRIKDNLFIFLELWLDQELLQNYTSKARIEKEAPGSFGL